MTHRRRRWLVSCGCLALVLLVFGLVEGVRRSDILDGPHYVLGDHPRPVQAVRAIKVPSDLTVASEGSLTFAGCTKSDLTPCAPSWQRTYCTADGKPIDPRIAESTARSGGLDLGRRNATDMTVNGIDRAHQVFVMIDLRDPGCVKVSADGD